MRGMARAITGLDLPVVEKIAEEAREDAFQVLIATMLSARTQDATTAAASARLFREAPTARRDGRASGAGDREADLSRELLPHEGAARESRRADPARSLRRPRARRRWRSCSRCRASGGRRRTSSSSSASRACATSAWTRTCTASRTASAGCGRRTPEQTEQALYERVPARWWPYINLYLVTWGQNVCRPTHPRCGDCAVADRCPRSRCDEGREIRVRRAGDARLVYHPPCLRPGSSPPALGR